MDGGFPGFPKKIQLVGGVFSRKLGLPSRELTYPPQKWHFEDDFPFPKVGYVNSLAGKNLPGYIVFFCHGFGVCWYFS